jgi:uncharacterized protein YndB with AHSA1/START domain
MLETIEVTALLPASPERIYRAWLDDQEHTAFTGGRATVEPHVGGRHTAWDGYVEGLNLELVPGQKIVQSWRSSEFPPGALHSRLEVRLEPADGGTRITIVHSDIPEGQGKQYEQGWRDHYFVPMASYFAGVTYDPEPEVALPEVIETLVVQEMDVVEELELPPVAQPLDEPKVAKPKRKSAVKAKPGAKAKAAKAKARPKAKAAKAKVKARPKAKVKAKPKAKVKAKVKAKPKAKPKPKAKAKPKKGNKPRRK